MAKPNFSFQKRQKELARQKKQEEKKQRKLEKSNFSHEEAQDSDSGGSQDETSPAVSEQNQA